MAKVIQVDIQYTLATYLPESPLHNPPPITLPTMSKLLAPIYLPGQEPMPAGTTPEEREEMQNVQRWQKYATMGMESCPVKVGMSAGAGESRRFARHIMCGVGSDSA
jgi:hypothetical protein